MPADNNFDFDLQVYQALLKAVASMSRLYSDNNKAFIHPRFVEKLYTHCSGAQDLSRRDMSFDALLRADIGVGVKTFITENPLISKSEKVAEFTRHASVGEFDNLDHYGKAIKSAELRNSRVNSDANEYSIDINKSIYHCLVRTNNGALIHEEPYQLINTSGIIPTDVRGNEIKEFITDVGGHTYFSDGKSNYCFNRSKNVLYKKFDLSLFKNSEIIPLEIFDDILERVLNWTNFSVNQPNIQLPNNTFTEQNQILEPGMDYVVLPLYGTRYREKEVQPKSAINQWNAGGRERKFGESYILIPIVIHQRYPDFFPDRDVKFKVKLPNGNIISAKVCQENNKALMSDPNTALCDWLYNIIDLTKEQTNKRFAEGRPYTYQDLKNVGKDSVKIIKVIDKEYQYELETADLGSFDNFLDNNKDNEDEAEE